MTSGVLMEEDVESNEEKYAEVLGVEGDIVFLQFPLSVDEVEPTTQLVETAEDVLECCSFLTILLT